MSKTKLFGGIIGGAILAVNAYADGSVEQNNLKLYVDFNKEATPVIAKDGCGLKKTENNTFAEGKFGKAVSFPTGTEQKSDLVYSLGDNLGNNNWTISFWIKLDEKGNAYGSGKGPSRTMFRTYRTGGWGDGDIFANLINWGRLEFNSFDGDKKCISTRIGAGVIPANEWTHVSFTYKNGSKRIYINGDQVKYIKNEKLKNPGTVQKFLRLGNMHAGAKDQLRGSVDELKVFDKALNAEQVKAIMKSQPVAE